MKELFRKNRYFLILQILFLAVGAILMLVYSKAELHILFNQFHSEAFDAFFRLITELGNGIVYVPVLLILLNKKTQWLITYLVAVAGSNLILVLSKQLIFSESYRPSRYFELFESYKLQLVEGVNLHALHSFPSGHTTTAFTVFFFLTLICKNNFVKLILFVVALLTAFSRVYLSQHFFADIFVGSILGTGSVLLAAYWIIKKEKDWMTKPFSQYLLPQKKK